MLTVTPSWSFYQNKIVNAISRKPTVKILWSDRILSKALEGQK